MTALSLDQTSSLHTSSSDTPRLLGPCFFYLISRTFPNRWKTAYLYPISKKRDKQNVENYTISILRCLSKIFDSIVSKRIFEYFMLKIVKKQHGFTKRRSTITNLLLFTNYIFQSFESSLQVNSLYIDFSKTFDSESHVRLLQKI